MEGATEGAAEGGSHAAPRLKMPEILAELEEAAKQLAIRVSYENLAGELGSGGLCKVRGEWRAILDKRCTPGERVSILAMALTRFPLDGVTMSQSVRELIEQAGKQAELLAEKERAETEAEAEAAAEAATGPQGPTQASTPPSGAGPHDGLAQS